VRLGQERIEAALVHVGQIPLGGTATGTGLNTHPKFADRVRRLLVQESKLKRIAPPADPFEAQANRDALVELSGALKVVAVSLTKIAQDVALMGSGPRAGIGELYLPELQKGSSIMPGKVNPVMPEVVLQVCAQVIGNDTAVTVGGMQGQFELNVRIPLIARNLLQSIGLLAAASDAFAEKCIDGIEPNREGLKRSAESTLAVATALNEHIGYDKGTTIVKKASESGRNLRDVALEEGVDPELYDRVIDLRRIAQGSAADGAAPNGGKRRSGRRRAASGRS
jgi:fumarate hydratase, class II